MHQILSEVGFECPAITDLRPLAELAYSNGIISRRAMYVLLDINKDANDAKHQLEFRSRM